MNPEKVATYCQKVCKAKCCTLRLPDEGEIPCPNLKADSSCSVYQERYQGAGKDQPVMVVGYWQSRKYRDLSGSSAQRPFFCGRIVQMLKAGQVPPEVAKGCVYAHPELLSKVDEL